MTVEKTMDGSTAMLRLEGWLDTQNAPVLAQALNELDDSVEKLVLDMEKLEYISSAGIRQIVTAYKEMNGALTLKKLSTEVASVLHMTGLDKKLSIES
jgi:anti-anti-sigma factor